MVYVFSNKKFPGVNKSVGAVKSGIMPNQELASQHVYQFDKKYINLINFVWNIVVFNL